MSKLRRAAAAVALFLAVLATGLVGAGSASGAATVAAATPTPATAEDAEDPEDADAEDVTIVNSDASGNQVSRFDVNGNALDAHDGSIIKVGDTFYLYGTSYACGYEYGAPWNDQFCGFKAYSSPDLVHWTDRGYVVPPGVCRTCFRPQVVFNPNTNRFVLWADLGNRYGVYSSSQPTGLFTQHPSPDMAIDRGVDMTLFVDDDGTGYVVHNTVDIVRPGDTADGVVEKLSPDYLTVTGEHVRLDLGNVEAFAVFKRDGLYHIMMSDPTCAYCAGNTGVLSTTDLLDFSKYRGRWYDPNGWNIYENRPQPRWRSRIVHRNSCGGQPLAVLPIQHANDTTGYYFISDRWNNRARNESLANLYIGPLSFRPDGEIADLQCVNSFSLSLPGTGGSYDISPHRDQHSGFDGFRHYCDINAKVSRQQSFTPSRSGTLTAASITAFKSGAPGAYPNQPLVVEVVDAATNTVLSSTPFEVETVPWAPTALVARSGIAVTAGKSYLLRARSSTTAGCYGFEYNDSNPYARGAEAYKQGPNSWVTEAARDLKFTTDVRTDAVFTQQGMPAGFTRCAGEGASCSFTGQRVVAYGAGSYRLKTSASTGCGIVAFGGDPAVGVLKSCYVAPAGGPSGWTQCVTEGATCTVGGSSAVVAYGANGAFTYKLVDGWTACTAAAFGADPILGTQKACYTAPAGAPSGNWTACATERYSCAVTGAQTILYGAHGAFVTKWTTGGTVRCNDATFGGDPNGNAAKSCYRWTGGPAGYGAACAGQSGQCAFSGFRTVAYGASGSFVYRSFTGGTACNPNAFGRDPIIGVVKSCYLTP